MRNTRLNYNATETEDTPPADFHERLCDALGLPRSTSKEDVLDAIKRLKDADRLKHGEARSTPSFRSNAQSAYPANWKL